MEIQRTLNFALFADPANISTSDQRCFNIVDKSWNNVDPTLKMKQNPKSDFQCCLRLIQRQCATLKQHQNNVTQRGDNVAQRWYNVGTTLIQSCFKLASTLVKAMLNPVGLVIIMDLQIDEQFLFC